MDYFNNVLTTFLGLERDSCMLFFQDQKALGFNQKYLNLCSEDEDDLMGLERQEGEEFDIRWILWNSWIVSNFVSPSIRRWVKGLLEVRLSSNQTTQH